MEFTIFKDRLIKTLSVARVRHIQGVFELAGELALLYGADLKKTVTAAALHDIAREYDAQKLIGLAETKGMPIDDLERHAPVLLHGKVGAFLAETEWGIHDLEILDAIRLHITGDTKMSLIAQIVFLADFAEAGRTFVSSRFARDLCRLSRISALEYVLNQEIVFVINQGYLVHPKTLEARNHLLIHGDLT
jgi:predicted HD superfamily hydrolase involved in NAD metabolism